jgi:hypothetical protein
MTDKMRDDIHQQAAAARLIASRLSGKEWDADDIEYVAGILRSVGLEIRDPNEPRVIENPPPLKHDAMMLERFGHKLSPNGILERRIVWNLFKHLEARGWYVRATWDGEERERVNTPQEAMEFIFNLDEVSVRMAKGAERIKGEDWHGILLVLGNGVDIVSDWNYTKGDPDGFSAAMDAFDAEDYA